MQVMLRMIRRTGRCPLPLHDSFLVPDIDAKPLADTMREVAHEYGLHPALKVLRQGHPATYLFHLEVTAPDLRKGGEGFEQRKKAFSGGHVAFCFRDVVHCPNTGFIYGHDPPGWVVPQKCSTDG